MCECVGVKVLPVPAPEKKVESEGRGERPGIPGSGRDSGEKVGRAHPERRSRPDREGRLGTGTDDIAGEVREEDGPDIDMGG